MELLAKLFIGILACIHLYIMWFEMFAWERKGPRVFTSFPKNLFSKTKAMAANQGLYNGFLAAGLTWSLLITSKVWSDYIGLYFLTCVAIAGIYGFLTVDKKIIIVQTVPATIAILLIILR